MLTLYIMDIDQDTGGSETPTHKFKRKPRHVFLIPLIWEIVRFGFVWNMTSRSLNPGQDWGTGLYLLWFSAPALAVISLLCILWLSATPQPAGEAAAAMAKGFQGLLGLAAAVPLISELTRHQLFYRGEGIVVGGLAVMDLLMCVLLIRILVPNLSSKT